MHRYNHNEIVLSGQQRATTDAATATGMQQQRDFCLDAATTKALARCCYNEKVAGMQPQRGD